MAPPKPPSRRWLPRSTNTTSRRSGGRPITPAATCWTPPCGRCRTGSRGSCTCAGPSWPAATCARLPRYMVPQRIVIVDAVPLTPNGKLDEAALAAIDSVAVTESGDTEPETATEYALIEVLAEILQVARIDPNADFLELGLDSIV